MKYGCAVYDRDGGVIIRTYLYDTPEEADKAGEFHIDDPRYGSHEVEEVDDE
jgi:hypothetical protein